MHPSICHILLTIPFFTYLGSRQVRSIYEWAKATILRESIDNKGKLGSISCPHARVACLLLLVDIVDEKDTVTVAHRIIEKIARDAVYGEIVTISDTI